MQGEWLLKEFEQELIFKLNCHFKNIAITSYLGEFENMKELEKCIKNAPLILVDFEGERYANLSQKESTYKIYMINSTSNKDESYRQQAKFELFDIIEEVDEILIKTKLNNGFRIEPIAITKVYEGVSQYGYLSVYAREIKTKLAEVKPFMNSELTSEEIQFLEGN